MIFLSILLFLTQFAAASFTNCASNRYALPLSDLFIDPPAVVAANQPVHMRLAFEVPHYTYVPHGHVEISTSWNGLILTTERHSLGDYIQVPLFAGHHTFTRSFKFPADV
jgi:hypothetical protein